MDAGSWIRIILLIVLLMGSFYFSGVETAFSSVNKVRIRGYAEDGNKKAAKALYIVDHFDRAIITSLIGNNIVNTGAAALVTAIVIDTWGEGAVGIATIITTLILFFFSETLPKNIAKDRSEDVSMAAAPSLSFLMTIARPIAFIFSGISTGLTKLFGVKDEPSVTEDELYDLIENIEEESDMGQQKSELVQSAMDFFDITVQDVFTPRVDVVALDIDDDDETNNRVIQECKHSRLPVYKGSIDNIIGILHVRNYLRERIKTGKADIAALMTPPYFIPQTGKIDEQLAYMGENKVPLAVVTDEYGGTMGIVTTEDILEELVGEIWDEEDEVVEEFVDIGGNRYEVLGNLLVEDVFDRMDYEDYDEEEDEFAHKTISAWALEQFEYIPKEGESFQWKDLVITVKQVDKSRITRLVIKKTTTEASDNDL